MNEKELEIVNNGKIAAVAYDFSIPFLNDAEKAALSEMKIKVRSGEATLEFLLSKVSTLNAIEDIRNAMTSRIEYKNRTILKENKNATSRR